MPSDDSDVLLFVFDTNAFVVLSHYFPDVFPSVWTAINASVAAGTITSVREVRKELETQATRKHLADFVSANPALFPLPSEDELRFVREIFAVPHFQQLITRRNMLVGLPVADPFVIAAAKCRSGCVVTEEILKPGAAKIPNVCQHFGIPFCNTETFMRRVGWNF